MSNLLAATLYPNPGLLEAALPQKIDYMFGPITVNCSYHGNPQPSFLGVITHILGLKTLIFPGFGFNPFEKY